MKFHIGPVPKPIDFEPDQSWTALKEPSVMKKQLISFPMGIIMAIIVHQIWIHLTPFKILEISSIPKYFLTLLETLVIHETFHLIAHPNLGLSSKSHVVIWLSKLMTYTYYDGGIKRNRFILIQLLPLIAISLIAPFVCVVLQFYTPWLFIVSVVNALSACVDLYYSLMILNQVPRGAIVKNHGWRTYWKII